jgi:hypothetical protein
VVDGAVGAKRIKIIKFLKYILAEDCFNIHGIVKDLVEDIDVDGVSRMQLISYLFVSQGNDS